MTLSVIKIAAESCLQDSPFFEEWPCMRLKIPYFHSSISFRLISLFFLIYVTLCSVLCLLVGLNFKRHLLETYKAFSREHVNKMAKSVDMLLSASENKLHNLKSVLETIQLNLAEKEALLVQTSLDDANLSFISLLDISGNVLVSSDPSRDHDEVTLKRVQSECMAGKVFSSGVFLNEAHYPTLRKGMPVYYLGEIVNFLYTEINLIGMWKLLDGLNQEGIGEYFILSSEGLVIAYKDMKVLLRPEESVSKEISKGAIESLDSTKIIQLPENELLLSACVIEKLGYFLVLQIDLKIILSEIREMFLNIIGIATLIIFCALIIVWRVSNRISRPILSLVKDLDYMDQTIVPRNEKIYSRQDEIGILYRAFNEMNEKVVQSRAREKLAVIGESLMKISHEIKNPLTAIKNFVTLHVSQPGNQEIFDKFKKAVPDEINRIQHLFDDLSQMSLGRKLNKKTVEVTEIIQDIMLLFEEEFNQCHITAKIQLPDEPLVIDIDVFKFKSVLVNLIKNAVEIMTDGGHISVHVFKTVFSDKSKCLIRILDSGPGLSEELLANIFNPFFTTKEKGMGLGLAICKGIIAQHGGDLSASNGPEGRGALFEIQVPCH